MSGSNHKLLEEEGLTELCDHIKGVRAAAEQVNAAAVALDEALASLDKELRSLTGGLKDDMEELANAIITGTVDAIASRRNE